jgi:hypothetical protein
MRLKSALALLPVLAGICFAQDTNFPVGPQYLITNGTPLTIRPIATPSLSLGEAHPFVADVNATGQLAEQAASVSSAPNDTFLGAVYWGEHKDAEIVARRLETPGMSVSDTALYMNYVAAQISQASAAPAESGETPAGTSVIEIAGAELPPNLPASILDVGVTRVADSQSLTTHGDGVPLGDVADYWKSHKRAAPHVFTNSDIRPRR